MSDHVALLQGTPHRCCDGKQRLLMIDAEHLPKYERLSAWAVELLERERRLYSFFTDPEADCLKLDPLLSISDIDAEWAIIKDPFHPAVDALDTLFGDHSVVTVPQAILPELDRLPRSVSVARLYLSYDGWLWWTNSVLEEPFPVETVQIKAPLKPKEVRHWR